VTSVTQKSEVKADMAREHSALSLFTGGGGLALGLEQSGFAIKVCVEYDHDRCETLRQNRPKWRILEKDIVRTSTKEVLDAAHLRVGEAELISGGPSCQPFSKSAFWVKGRIDQIASDPRAKLLEHFARIIIEAKPKAFLMENVHGLVYKTSKLIFDKLIRSVEVEGYTCSWEVLNAADYGVPQRRRRVFVVGSRSGARFNFPSPMYGNDTGEETDRRNYITAGEAIDYLDDGTALENEKPKGKWGHLLPLIPPGGNYLHLTERGRSGNPLFKWRSRYWSFLLKLDPNQVSWTIQARPGPYTGPFHWRNRILRIAEIKALQGFPDEWRFFGEKRSTWAQIGDATPPPVSNVLGNAIIEQLLK
jgi:DNA (cytosine-5)-methyltransferase 1